MFGELAPRVPVILTVERGAQEFPFELLEKGACDFVFKSNPARLLAVIERECANVNLSREERKALVSPERIEQIDEGVARFFQLASNIPECYWLTDAATQRVNLCQYGLRADLGPPCRSALCGFARLAEVRSSG